ncbi:hypothetical protein C1G87_1401 [Dehalococcoides mccartyi]|uniref:Uncharacterized protein n=2 Tax=Dehalococcoidaceae TaxID=1202464 RepID=A0A328EK75_9CHLR|nr:hypothetical protein dcmb_1395 [Dehalococcoides mccartyi DCMB5]RAL68927.1 hypothetical protein C1G87_1401 [Dehalococcoides mccartyi]
MLLNMDKYRNEDQESRIEKTGELSPVVLTCIYDAYTLSATSYQTGVDQLMIKEFLNALAEVALSVASRRDYQND